jgi:hypothetical protein
MGAGAVDLDAGTDVISRPMEKVVVIVKLLA